MCPDTHEHRPAYNFSDLEDGIHLISEKLQELEDEYKEALTATRQFHAKRSSLLQMLNNSRALTKNLPSETMSLIFQHARNQTHQIQQLDCTLILGHVSSRWRQIVWSTPQLWMSLRRTFASVNPHSVNATIQLLQLHLRNVGALRFSLSIHFPIDRPLTEESLDRLVEVLSDEENSGKIRSLTMSPPPGVLINCLSNGTFPRLELLRLTPVRTQWQQEFALTNLPHLRKLHLVGTVPITIELSWLIITTLVLDHFPIDICMKLFLQCPNLIHAHILSPASSSTNESGLPLWMESTDTITFPHLAKLSWSYHADPICLTVFRRICAPSLRELKCSDSRGRFLLQELTNFPSISTLTHLSFWCLEGNPCQLFREIFSRTKCLQSLVFEDCGYADVENALALALLDSTTQSETQSVYLPLLNELRISGGYCTGDIDVDSQWMVLRLLERQQSSGVCSFRLDVDPPINWDPEVEEAMESLVRKGFKLELSKFV